MSQTSLITILAFVAGLGSGYFARSAAGMLHGRTHAADLAAIEKLNPIMRARSVSEEVRTTPK